MRCGLVTTLARRHVVKDRTRCQSALQILDDTLRLSSDVQALRLKPAVARPSSGLR